MPKAWDKTKINVGKLIDFIFDQHAKTGFVPNSRDIAKRFKCSQTLAVTYMKILIADGYLLKRNRQYALPPVCKYSNKRPKSGHYWHMPMDNDGETMYISPNKYCSVKWL